MGEDSTTAESLGAPEADSASGLTAATAARPRPERYAKCYFCGNRQHPRSESPAREAICHLCSTKGHFAKVCKKSARGTRARAALNGLIAEPTDCAPSGAPRLALMRVSPPRGPLAARSSLVGDIGPPKQLARPRPAAERSALAGVRTPTSNKQQGTALQTPLDSQRALHGTRAPSDGGSYELPALAPAQPTMRLSRGSSTGCPNDRQTAAGVGTSSDSGFYDLHAPAPVRPTMPLTRGSSPGCLNDRKTAAGVGSTRELHKKETALMKVMNDIPCKADQALATVQMLLDLSAAFGTMDQNIESMHFLFRPELPDSSFHTFGAGQEKEKEKEPHVHTTAADAHGIYSNKSHLSLSQQMRVGRKVCAVIAKDSPKIPDIYRPLAHNMRRHDYHCQAQAQCRPTSPLRECHSVTEPKRLQAVHFSNGYTPHTQIQSVYHSLQDLSSDHMQLANDFEREIERRTRIEHDTQQYLRELSDMVRMSGTTDEVPSTNMGMYERQQLQMLQHLKKKEALYEHCHKQQQTELQQAEQPTRLMQVNHEAEEPTMKQGQRLVDGEGEVIRLSAYLSKAEQLASTEKKCEELKMKAREALRQWKTRCLAAEELGGQNARDAEAARCQLSAAAQQAETLRQELALAATWRKTQNEEAQRLELALQMTFKRAEELDVEMLDQRKSARKRELVLSHCERKIVCLEAERQKVQDEVTRLKLEHRCKNDEVYKIIDITKRRAEEAECKATFARKEICRLKEEVMKLMIQLEKERQCQKQKETEGQYSTSKTMKAQQEEKAQNLINRTLSEQPSLENTVQAPKVKVMACNADCFAKLMQSENELRERVVMLEADIESFIMTFEQEVQELCQVMCKDSTDLHVVAESKRQVEPCRWLAETKARLQWLCGESRERQHRENQLRCQLQHCRKQLCDITYHLEVERQQTTE
uniref:centrosomal protein of 128 kDa-like n=1 Tax=Myxine glutinosa TaxID=7769 RepID=UPI00358EB5B6